MSYYVRRHEMSAFHSTKSPPPPQNVRLFRKFVISSLPRKNPRVWNNLHIISAAILPKNTRPNYIVTICRLTLRQKLYRYEETKLQFTVFKMSI